MDGNAEAVGPDRRAGPSDGIRLAVTPGGVAMSIAVALAVAPGGPTAAWSDRSEVLRVVVLALLVAASVVAHELGHVLVARRHGLRVDRVRLSFLGGSTELIDPIDRARSELRIALAGPLTSLVTAAVLAGAASYLDRLGTAGWPRSLGLLAAWNLVIALANLVPVRPLDGGHVVAALRRRGEARD